jgi:hypothetical protein
MAAILKQSEINNFMFLHDIEYLGSNFSTRVWRFISSSYIFSQSSFIPGFKISFLGRKVQTEAENSITLVITWVMYSYACIKKFFRIQQKPVSIIYIYLKARYCMHAGRSKGLKIIALPSADMARLTHFITLKKITGLRGHRLWSYVL